MLAVKQPSAGTTQLYSAIFTHISGTIDLSLMGSWCLKLKVVKKDFSVLGNLGVRSEYSLWIECPAVSRD